MPLSSEQILHKILLTNITILNSAPMLKNNANALDNRTTSLPLPRAFDYTILDLLTGSHAVDRTNIML